MSDMETRGRKEVAEAVLQAAIIAVIGGLITWGLEAVKSAVKVKQDSEKPDGEKEP